MHSPVMPTIATVSVLATMAACGPLDTPVGSDLPVDNIVSDSGSLLGDSGLDVGSVAESKSAEARSEVTRMAKLAAAAYETNRSLCTTASGSVPLAVLQISGKQYQSTATDWQRDGSRTGKGFACLKFDVTNPQSYMYLYFSAGIGDVVGDSFTASANGDLNGDGVLSTFSITGTIEANGHVRLAPMVEITPDE